MIYPIPVDERFSAALHGSARTWRLALDKRLKHLGIGQSGWMTIAMVAKADEPLSQRALADLVGVEGPSMVAMLDRLERDGFVTRAPSAARPPRQAGTADRRRPRGVRRGQVGGRRLPRRPCSRGIDPQALAAATALLETVRTRIEEPL